MDMDSMRLLSIAHYHPPLLFLQGDRLLVGTHRFNSVGFGPMRGLFLPATPVFLPQALLQKCSILIISQIVETTCCEGRPVLWHVCLHSGLLTLTSFLHWGGEEPGQVACCVLFPRRKGAYLIKNINTLNLTYIDQ